jgi:hypothetical protein
MGKGILPRADPVRAGEKRDYSVFGTGVFLNRHPTQHPSTDPFEFSICRKKWCIGM